MIPALVCGAGGHARVLLELLRTSGHKIAGVCSPTPPDIDPGVPWLGDDAWLSRQSPSEFVLVNGLGSVGDPSRRIKLFLRFKSAGFMFPSLFHPSAVIASGVHFGEGCQIMAGVVLQPGCVLGENVIVNTRSSVDHDCYLGDHVHLAPGVVFSGNVRVGAQAHVGPGTTVVQGIQIGERSLVGAGALVLRDVAPGTKVFGVPAKSQNPAHPGE